MEQNKYLVISLKHSDKKATCFWRSDNKGYTYNPLMAGHYYKDDIDSHQNYYNDGVSNIAVPLDETVLERMGFKVTIDTKALIEYHQRNTQK